MRAIWSQPHRVSSIPGTGQASKAAPEPHGSEADGSSRQRASGAATDTGNLDDLPSQDL
jgi:hypothetical protein